MQDNSKSVQKWISEAKDFVLKQHTASEDPKALQGQLDQCMVKYKV